MEEKTVCVTGRVVGEYLAWHNVVDLGCLHTDPIARLMLSRYEIKEIVGDCTPRAFIADADYFLWFTTDPRPDGVVVVKYADGMREVMFFIAGASLEAVTGMVRKETELTQEFNHTEFSVWLTASESIPSGKSVMVALANVLPIVK